MVASISEIQRSLPCERKQFAFLLAAGGIDLHSTKKLYLARNLLAYWGLLVTFASRGLITLQSELLILKFLTCQTTGYYSLEKLWTSEGTGTHVEF